MLTRSGWGISVRERERRKFRGSEVRTSSLSSVYTSRIASLSPQVGSSVPESRMDAVSHHLSPTPHFLHLTYYFLQALPHQRMNPSSANLARSLGPKPRRTEPRRVEANAATVGIKETKNVEFVFDIPFVIKLREEEEERPLRSQRYTADKLPRPATTTCGPFTFTLSFSERTSPMSFAIDLKIIRTTAEADDVFDCSVPFNNSHCCFGSRSYKFEETNFLVQPKIGRKVGSTLSLRHVVAYQNLSELFGVKEPVEMEVRVHTLGSTSFPIPRRQTKCDTRILDSLPHYVDSPSPNNVAFVLSRSGNKRLFASKSLLASSSSYFKEAFNPSRRSSRTPFSSDSGPSFVDDSDAEEATEERPESEEDDLPHPDQIGTRSSSKRLTEGRQSGEDAGGTPSKRRKTGGAKREEEEADQEGEAQQDMTVIHVDDVEYSTLRALLVFLIGAKIQFA